MPWWCDKHKQHSIDEGCWQCDNEARIAAAAPALLEALRAILEIGKRDMSNPKYDGYFESAYAAVAQAEGTNQ